METERTHQAPLIPMNLAPVVVLVSGGRLTRASVDALVSYFKEVGEGRRPMAMLIEAERAMEPTGDDTPRVEVVQLAYDLAPVRFFIDHGTPEDLVTNCAIAAHEAARRAGDPEPSWSELTEERRQAVLALTRDILEGKLAGEQRAMRAAAGNLLEGAGEGEEQLNERQRLAVLFYGVVELMRAELDILRHRRR